MSALPLVSESELPLIAARESGGGPGVVVAESPLMRRLLERLRAAATVDRPVLLVGATGTGRGFLARVLHGMAGRDKRQLVEVSCLSAPLPEFWTEAAERARGGTLLVTDLDRLDEYGQRDLHCVLAKLATQAKPPQLVATALPEIDQQPRAGRFARALYDRLAVLRIDVPTLQERSEDLPVLAQLLLTEQAAAHGRPSPVLTTEAQRLLKGYSWPGNVRELSNILWRALLWTESSTIPAEQLQLLLPASQPRAEVRLPIGTTLADAEQQLILATLRACDGNKQLTASRLGITRRTLYQKLTRYKKWS
jgi:DNA-binding NtrC family response regulator